MCEKIYQQLSEHFIRQMRNWARWQAGADGAYSIISSIYRGERLGDSYDGAPIPILSGEATDTQDALCKLPIRYQAALTLFWCWEGQPMTSLARRCAIDYRTFEKRVIEGHEKLKTELAVSSQKFHKVA